jgi:hypothetical protein
MGAKENFTNINTWIRGLFIILFGIVFYIAYGWIVWLLVLFQFVTKLLTGKPNDQLLEMTPKVTAYAYDILRYVTYESNTKPWPLSQTTAGDIEEPADTEQTSADEAAPASETGTHSDSGDSPDKT